MRKDNFGGRYQGRGSGQQRTSGIDNPLSAFSATDYPEGRKFENGNQIQFLIYATKFEKGCKQKGVWNYVKPVDEVDPVTGFMVEVPNVIDEESDMETTANAQVGERLINILGIRDRGWSILSGLNGRPGEEHEEVVFALVMVPNPEFIRFQANIGGMNVPGAVAPAAEIFMPDHMIKELRSVEMTFATELQKLQNGEFKGESLAKLKVSRNHLHVLLKEQTDKRAKMLTVFSEFFGDTALHIFKEFLNNHQYRHAWSLMKTHFTGVNHGQDGRQALLNLLQQAVWEIFVPITDYVNVMNLIRQYYVDAGGIMPDDTMLDYVKNGIEKCTHEDKPFQFCIDFAKSANFGYDQFCESIYKINAGLVTRGYWTNLMKPKASVNSSVITTPIATMCNQCNEVHYGPCLVDRVCFICKQKGHLSFDCPDHYKNKRKVESTSSTKDSTNVSGKKKFHEKWKKS